MDDDPEYDENQEEPDTAEMEDITETVADVPFSPQINRAVAEKATGYGKDGILKDNSGERASLKEKLVMMTVRLGREKVYGQERQKSRGKEETL